MNGYGCHVRNLRNGALSGFRSEKEALSAGGHYLNPDDDGWIDASGLSGLCVVCENCGSVMEGLDAATELMCPDCGENLFRVLQTFRLVPIKGNFAARWQVTGLQVAIDVPQAARKGMVSIRYTVDGSEPTLCSPVYTGPIPYQKSFMPIRVAVFYADARSQIIEWDYGRAEKNRERIKKQSETRNTPRATVKLSRSIASPGDSDISKTMPRDLPPKRAPKEGKDDGMGCGCLLVLILVAMMIGGILLLVNDSPFIGCILIGIGVQALRAIFKGVK